MESNTCCTNTGKWLTSNIDKYNSSIENCKNTILTEFIEEDHLQFIQNNIIPFVSIKNQCTCSNCTQLMYIYSKILSNYNNNMLDYIIKHLPTTIELQSVHDNLVCYKKAQRYKDRYPEKYESKKLDLVNTITDLLTSNKDTFSNDYIKILEDGVRQLCN